MTNYSLFALVALAVTATHALPKPGAQLATVTVSPRAALPAASPYPASPTTNEFKYRGYDEHSKTDKNNRKIVHDAFTDWSPMLSAAIASLRDTDDLTFNTWFPKTLERENFSPLDARGYVEGVITRMFAPGLEPPAPKAIVAKFISEKDDISLTCEKDKTVHAYFVKDQGRFHVCPTGLEGVTGASEIDCGKLGNRVGRGMESLTQTLVHEFFHSNLVGDKAPSSAGHIVDIIYGSSGCMRMVKGDKAQEAFINADSYTWFATNAYYNSVCERKFSLPEVTQEDFDYSEAELLASPEYDAALSDGVLAGV
ncbi:hypothetical protein LTR95_004450 [Oleoguttula sp. CCFEE 5521]